MRDGISNGISFSIQMANSAEDEYVADLHMKYTYFDLLYANFGNDDSLPHPFARVGGQKAK